MLINVSYLDETCWPTEKTRYSVRYCHKSGHHYCMWIDWNVGVRQGRPTSPFTILEHHIPSIGNSVHHKVRQLEEFEGRKLLVAQDVLGLLALKCRPLYLLVRIPGNIFRFSSPADVFFANDIIVQKLYWFMNPDRKPCTITSRPKKNGRQIVCSSETSRKCLDG